MIFAMNDDSVYPSPKNFMALLKLMFLTISPRFSSSGYSSPSAQSLPMYAHSIRLKYSCLVYESIQRESVSIPMKFPSTPCSHKLRR